jgi:hypothetical protein
LLAFVGWGNGQNNFTVGSGWTQLDSVTVSSVKVGGTFYRYVQSGDAAGLPGVMNGSTSNWNGVQFLEIAGVSGVIATDIVDHNIKAQGSGSTITSTAFVSTQNDQLALDFFGNYDAVTEITVSTTGFERGAAGSNSSNYGGVGVFRKVFPTSGTSISATASMPDTGHAQVAAQIVIQGGGAAPPVQPFSIPPRAQRAAYLRQ